MTSKKDTLFNYFGEQQTAHVYAYYKGGEFYDYYTHEKVTLDEGRHNEPFDKNNPSGISRMLHTIVTRLRHFIMLKMEYA